MIFKLKIMQFLQFFIWGCWLVTIGSYAGTTLNFTGLQIGSIYGAVGLASLITPNLAGIISDKWIPANQLYVICHIISAVTLILVTFITNYYLFYTVMLVNLLAFMPTLSLSYSIAYSCFSTEKRDPITTFPPVRVWGTVGFIVAMWTISLAEYRTTVGQFYIAAIASIILCLFIAIVLPKIAIKDDAERQNQTLVQRLGLDAFVLFKDPKMGLFLLFSMLLGAILHISNSWADLFIGSFASIPEFSDSLAVKYPTILVSLSQIAEVGFILLVPFFLKRFGIKYVMLISTLAWVLRFTFFAYGDPSVFGMVLLVLSMLCYGCAFDFFNISGSLYVEKSVRPEIRNSAQGLFISLTNGFGALVGGYFAGMIVDIFSTYNTEGIMISRDWNGIWLCFASYSLILAVIFMFTFKDSYQNQVSQQVN